jgi:hypothetical protein
MGAEKKIGPTASGTPVEQDASHQREKRAVPDRVELYVAEFRRRSEGLTGDEREAEIARLMDRIIERHLAAAPEGVRPELRETLLRLLKTDPAFAPMLAELRGSATK